MSAVTNRVMLESIHRPLRRFEQLADRCVIARAAERLGGHTAV